MINPENARALMAHMMKVRQQQHFLGDAIARSVAAIRPAGGETDGKEESRITEARMTETRIYVGLNDAETKEQLMSTEAYMEQLKEVCRSHQVAFSVDVEEGGYYHEDGQYTEETSFVLVLIDVGKDSVQAIAKDLCARFHQESVLVTENVLCGNFIYPDDKE